MTPETPSPLHILIVENDPSDQELLRELLFSSQLQINTIHTASNIREAKSFLNESPADLIILDLNLQDSSGLESFLLIQQAAYSIPVIIHTGIFDTNLALEAIKAGAQDFLIKGEVTPSLIFKSIHYSLERKKNMLELWESRERFYAVTKATKDAVWDWNLKNNTIWWSEGFKTVFGYENVVADASSWYDRIHPEDKQAVVHSVYQAIEGGDTNWSGEYRYLKADGSYAIVFDRGYTIRDESGNATRMVGSMMDITTAKKNEKALRESELRFRSLANQAPMFIWIARENAHVTYANKAMLDYFGLSSPEEISEEAWKQWIHPDDEAYVSDIFAFAYEAQKPYELECRMKSASGEFRWLYYKGVPRIVDSGRFVGFIGTAIDIHDRKIAEAALLESEERLRIAIESTQIGTWDYFPLTGDLIWSVNCKKIFGLSPDVEVDYDLFLQAVHPEDRIYTNEAVQSVLRPESGGYYNIEYRTVGIEDKKLRWVQATGRAFYDHNGIAYRFIGTVLDITQQQLAKETLEKSAEILERMVHERTIELEEANEHLRKSNAELEQFAYVASHDLQEPLRKILIFSDQLQTAVFADLPPNAQVWLEKIRHSAKRMSGLIKDLLEYSRLMNYTGMDHFHPVDLNHVVGQIQADLEMMIQQKMATIVVDQMPVIEAVEVQMNQLFFNLMSNSLKFSTPGRPLVINIAAHPVHDNELKALGLNNGRSYTRIVFSDNGIGFNQEFAEQIFSVFQRLHTKEQYPGTGIGLALCRKVVENHGGRIYALGEENRGADFIILMPLQQII